MTRLANFENSRNISVNIVIIYYNLFSNLKKKNCSIQLKRTYSHLSMYDLMAVLPILQIEGRHANTFQVQNSDNAKFPTLRHRDFNSQDSPASQHGN